MAAWASISIFHGSVRRFYSAETRESTYGASLLHLWMVRVEATPLLSLWVWFLCQLGLGVTPWEWDGSWGQLHRVFRPWIVRRTEVFAWILGGKCHFLSFLAHQNFGHAVLALLSRTLSKFISRKWGSPSFTGPGISPALKQQPRELVRCTSGKKMRILCVCLHISASASSIHVTCGGTRVFSYHFTSTPARSVGIGKIREMKNLGVRLTM